MVFFCFFFLYFCAVFIYFFFLLFLFVLFVGFLFTFLFCFVFIFSAFGGCWFSLGADWVFSSLFCFLNLSSKRLGHAVPDDVVMADIQNQARDIFIHGQVCIEKWHRKDIHSYIHSHLPIHSSKKQIYSHPSMHTPQKEKRKKKTKQLFPKHPRTLLKTKTNKKQNKNAKRSTHETWCFRLLVLFLSTVLVGDGQKAWQMILGTAPLQKPFHLGQYCAQEWHCKDIHSHIHSHPHTLKTNKEQNPLLTKHIAFV